MATQFPSESKSRLVKGEEKSSEYYDATFSKAKHWKAHYTESHYYPLWTVVADRIQSRKVRSILDIGCGPGQVAKLMTDTPGVSNYCGIDFSEKRIEQAKTVCKDFEFHCANIFETSLLSDHSYDCALIMEFLEHIEEDLRVIELVRPGTYVLATVPNFTSAGHVRFFDSAGDVHERYASSLDRLVVTTIEMNPQGHKHFILDGYR